MLLLRSISLKVFLFLFVNQLCAQEEYGLDGSEEYNSEYNEAEEHGHPDYSKYYSVDGPSQAQSIPASGFIGSSEFSGFFAPQPVEFAGTNTNKKTVPVPPINFVPQAQQSESLPFLSAQHLNVPLKDYFEESQKSQQHEKNNQPQAFIAPGPSYISHSIPVLGTFGEVKAASADDVERIPPRPNKPKKKKADEEVDSFEEVEDFSDDKEGVDSKNDKYGLDLLRNSKAFVDYTNGKSSSTVSQYPLAAGLVPKASKLKLTPYQKYSFQPLVQASRITPAEELLSYKPAQPFNPNYEKVKEVNIESQPSENVPSHLKNHNCRKLNGGDDNSAGMNCFVCTNEETNSKYTQCSYTSEKEPVEYYTGASERFSVPAKEGHFRYKRYANRKSDPYYEIRSRSIKTLGEPSIPEDYGAGFQYDHESYEDSPSEISYSEQQSEQLKKNPENCQKIEKDGSTCTVCRDPKTGGNYEQCSYSSAPSEKKYAYVKEKKYSDDAPEETKVVVKTAPKTKADLKVATTELKSETKAPEKDFESTEDYEGQIEQDRKKLKKRNDDTEDDPINYENYEKFRKNSEEQYLKEKELPNYFAESVRQESRQPKKEDEEDSFSKDFDEYHFKLFPELTKAESKQQEDSAEITENERESESENENDEYVKPEATKQNVEEVLAEFTKKDRSNCKKSEKNGMTCFLCVDKNKIQHEECMFVQESRPQSSHVAYHQLKGIKKLQKDEEQPDESKNNPIVAAEAKKVTTKVPSLAVAASEAHESRIPYEIEKKPYNVDKRPYQKKKRSPKEGQKKKNKRKQQEAEPTIQTPAEFEVEDEGGAFTAETKPVYSKVHGLSLPKYMVEKSEFEKEFDAFSGALSL